MGFQEILPCQVGSLGSLLASKHSTVFCWCLLKHSCNNLFLQDCKRSGVVPAFYPAKSLNSLAGSSSFFMFTAVRACCNSILDTMSCRPYFLNKESITQQARPLGHAVSHAL